VSAEAPTSEPDLKAQAARRLWNDGRRSWLPLAPFPADGRSGSKQRVRARTFVGGSRWSLARRQYATTVMRGARIVIRHGRGAGWWGASNHSGSASPRSRRAVPMREREVKPRRSCGRAEVRALPRAHLMRFTSRHL